MMRFFTQEEFACKHCGRLPERGLSVSLLCKLDKLREKVGHPIIVNSGYRCPEHNEEVGGVENSQHLLGCAADITCPNISVQELYSYALDIGFDGIGYYPDDNFIHVDCREFGNSPNTYRW